MASTRRSTAVQWQSPVVDPSYTPSRSTAQQASHLDTLNPNPLPQPPVLIDFEHAGYEIRGYSQPAAYQGPMSQIRVNPVATRGGAQPVYGRTGPAGARSRSSPYRIGARLTQQESYPPDSSLYPVGPNLYSLGPGPSTTFTTIDAYQSTAL